MHISPIQNDRRQNIQKIHSKKNSQNVKKSVYASISPISKHIHAHNLKRAEND